MVESLRLLRRERSGEDCTVYEMSRQMSAAKHYPEWPYAELHCRSNFSFLRGASHPEELVEQATALGYAALAITDRNSLAAVVRAHLAARKHGLHLIIGAEITPVDAPPVVLLAPQRRAYANLSRMITRGRLRARKGQCEIRLADVAELSAGLIALVPPPVTRGACEWTATNPHPDTCATDMCSDVAGDSGTTLRCCERAPRRMAALDSARQHPNCGAYGAPGSQHGMFAQALCKYRDIFGDNVYLAAELSADLPDAVRFEQLAELARNADVPLVAANDVYYHVPERRYLQDVLTCVREKCTIETAGTRLLANAERHLRMRGEISRRYAAYPELIWRTVDIAEHCTFSLDELQYEYPHEVVPAGATPHEYLSKLTWSGVRERYRHGPPAAVVRQLRDELALIAELNYEHYFLTVWDLVRFARGRGILCQGRGSAANSAVCYALGITAVDPARINLLFERFISRERNEPPDIDVDLEHERREEVFQYIYKKYGRERAALTAEVITYRPRSAVRDVGKALGLSLDRVDVLAKALDWWSNEAVPEEALRNAGLDPRDRTIQMVVRLVRQLLRFPRHLSQHVGGFVITETPLCEIVPLENGAMPDRTFIEWDKDDIDALGILKVDCLALGMLTALRKCLDMVNNHEVLRPGGGLAFHTIPAEDRLVYDMICAADTVGVFQIESRAQMSMLPRLRPRCFYDLVIEVAIVRPGPIQGGMIHPFLRRRDGLEPVWYPSPAVREVLEKTLGVPLFQEQVMRLAVVAAGFTPGEADRLRRSMAAWRYRGEMERFQIRLIKGMLAHGYSRAFAEQIYKQICGFGEYGFPESHAASFALLVYASAWLKRYHPAAFTAALLNSQPMGFYAPAQLVRDAIRHGVTVLGVDVNCSGWDCTLEVRKEGTEARRHEGTKGWGMTGQCRREYGETDRRANSCPAQLRGSAAPWQADPNGPALRLGFRLVRGLSSERVTGIAAARRAGPIRSIEALARHSDVSRDTLVRLAAADAFRSLGLDRRQALWRILALDDADWPLLAELEPDEPPAELPEMKAEEVVVQDYDALGLSLSAHPIGLLRAELRKLRVSTSEELRSTGQGRRIAVAGLVTHRQRPGTARGMVFMTLEDEAGHANLVIRPNVWARYKATARSKTALIADGVVERQGAVVNLQVVRLHDLSARISPIRAESRDFR